MQLISILFFYALIFLVGIAAYRRRERGLSSGDLLVAGRSMPVFLCIATMTATWVGGGYINGTAEAIYDSNLGVVWTQAPWGYAISMVIGGLFFAGKMRRMNYTTLLDPFEQRYGKHVAAWLFIPALIGEVFWSAAIMVALGTTFGTILGFDVTISILISATVAIGYTVVGGLWSVAYTDVLQLSCLMLGLFLAIPFAVHEAGGADFVFRNAFAQMPSFPTGTSRWVWFDMALLLCLGGVPWQVYFQRVLAAKNDRIAARFSIIAAIGCLLAAAPAVVIGCVGLSADWSQTAAGQPPESALVLPYVLKYLTPGWVATIGLGAVAAAVMSSVDSSILSASSLFVWNVYRPHLRPTAGEREIAIALRLAVVAVGVAATALALSVQSVYALWYLCADLVYVILFPQLVAALYVRSANSVGAVAAMFTGLVLRVGGGEATFGIPVLLPYPWIVDGGQTTEFPFRTFAMLSALLALILVSKCTKNISPPKPLQAIADRAEDTGQSPPEGLE